jgi:hypothetical protein
MVSLSAEESRGGRVTLVSAQAVSLITAAYARHLHYTKVRITGPKLSSLQKRQVGEEGART